MRLDHLKCCFEIGLTLFKTAPGWLISIWAREKPTYVEDPPLTVVSQLLAVSG
jgi:hypothetical protein